MIEQKSIKEKKYSYNLIGPHLGRIFIARLFDLILCSIPTLLLSIFNSIHNWQTLLINVAVSQIILFLYFILLPYIFKGNTLGKLIFRLRLINNNESKKIKFKTIFLREFYFLYVPLIFQLITQTISGVIIFTVPKTENIDNTLKIINNLSYLFLGIWFIYIPLTIYLQKDHISAIDLRLNTSVKYLEKVELKNYDKKENKVHVHLKENLPGNFDLNEVNDLIISKNIQEDKKHEFTKNNGIVLKEYEFLKYLNEQQLKAVEIIDQPLRVNAGPGTGKTRVIISKILYLTIIKKYDPSKVLAISFTNQAAKEMRNRICEYLPCDNQPWISTIHFLCHKILLEDGFHININSNFKIIDNVEQKKIIEKICSKYDIDKERKKEIIKFIKRMKYADIVELRKMETPTRNNIYLINSNIFMEYEEFKKENNLLDFTDLLIYTIKLFLNYESIKEKWADKFDYILVDETQDLNDDQIIIVNLLTNKTNHITIVGDVDQNIYSWMGSNAEFILYFESYYPNQITINLVENYRSTQHIVKIYNTYIKYNKKRMDKDVITNNKKGKNVEIYPYEDDEKIINKINFLINIKKYNYENILLLYRYKKNAGFLESALKKNKIPYYTKAISFFDRKVIKDLNSILSFVAYGDNHSAYRFLKLITKVGKVTIKKICENAKINNVRIFEYITSDLLDNTISENIVKVAKLLKYVKEEVFEKDGSIRNVLNNIVCNNLFLHNFNNLKEEDLELFKSYMEIAEQYDLEYERKKSLNQYYQNRTIGFLNDLVISIDDSESVVGNKLKLQSIHSAKGIENKVVIVLVENYSYLHFQNLEEERRIYYVAMSRAQEKLIIYSKNPINEFMLPHKNIIE